MCPISWRNSGRRRSQRLIIVSHNFSPFLFIVSLYNSPPPPFPLQRSTTSMTHCYVFHSIRTWYNVMRITCIQLCFQHCVSFLPLLCVCVCVYYWLHLYGYCYFKVVSTCIAGSTPHIDHINSARSHATVMNVVCVSLHSSVCVCVCALLSLPVCVCACVPSSHYQCVCACVPLLLLNAEQLNLIYFRPQTIVLESHTEWPQLR